MGRGENRVDRRALLRAVGAGAAAGAAGCIGGGGRGGCSVPDRPAQYQGRNVELTDFPELPMGRRWPTGGGLPFTVRVPEQMIGSESTNTYRLEHTCVRASGGATDECACSVLEFRVTTRGPLPAPYAVGSEGPTPEVASGGVYYHPTDETVSYAGETVRLWLARPDWQPRTGGDIHKNESVVAAFPRSGGDTDYVGAEFALQLDYSAPGSGEDPGPTVDVTTDLLGALHRGLVRIVRTVEPA